jgi:CheY-like chemotaxis protein
MIGMSEKNSLEREDFEKWVHDALNHLYDSSILEDLPLVDWLLPADRRTTSRSQDLRRLLLLAIQSLKPVRNTPVQSRDWRGYQILEQRFISALSPAEVVRRMNISRSLFFTEQALVLKRLADLLWEQRVEPGPANPPPAAPQSMPPAAEPERNAEAAGLLQDASLGPVPIHGLLQSLQPIMNSLARGRNVAFLSGELEDETIEQGDRVLLRQIIISLIAELAYLVPGGSIQVSSYKEAGRFGITLRAEGGDQAPEITLVEERQGLSPETCVQLLAAMGGNLEVRMVEPRGFEAVLSWKKERQPRQVLVVDDHADVADLFRRYLHGTGWVVLHAASAAQARAVLASVRPDVILLDVILPHEDGWEVLVDLKGNRGLRSIPVIVCSAVNEPELVRSLGAEGYLPKPVVQVELLKALRDYA